MGKTFSTATNRDDMCRTIAQIHGVSPRYVRMVRNGERENEAIAASLVDYNIGRNNLIKHLEKLVPVTSNSRNGRKKN
jgi:hypothetical protein